MRIPQLILPRSVDAVLARVLSFWASDVKKQLDGITEGQLAAHHNALTAPPTTGEWSQGDFIRNATPSELGTAGSRYVVAGWICVASGSPGTWKDARYLTGG